MLLCIQVLILKLRIGHIIYDNGFSIDMDDKFYYIDLVSCSLLGNIPSQPKLGALSNDSFDITKNNLSPIEILNTRTNKMEL